MRLTSGSSEKKTSLGIFAGIIKGLFGMLTLWFGLNSLLVGIAYSHQKGFWVPCLVGIVSIVTGTLLLFAGARQIIRNTIQNPDL